MKLPNLSFMMRVGQLRYIQSVYERDAARNPDLLVRDFLPGWQRWSCDLRGMLQLNRLRKAPFYWYVVARTKYYDCVFMDALCAGVTSIVNIGCGSDTRAYRYAHILKERGVRVLECDQAEAIHSKQRMVSGLWPTDHVEYQAIDLNAAGWPELQRWLQERLATPVLIMFEGVSPYVNEDAFGRFLDMLAANMSPSSFLAYDFKLPHVAQGFGKSANTHRPFRLSESQQTVSEYHRVHGLSLRRLESSKDLVARLLPQLSGQSDLLFGEDVLVRLTASPA